MDIEILEVRLLEGSNERIEDGNDWIVLASVAVSETNEKGRRHL